MAIRWYSVVIDSQDVAAHARWWATVLSWEVVYESDDEVVIAPPIAVQQEEDPSSTPFADRAQGWVFVPVPERKTVKNRIHLDLAPDPDSDHAAEVQRLLDLGARRVDVGQVESGPEAVTWTVLADPEDNEFCLLSPRD